jgi:hypothetical protein
MQENQGVIEKLQAENNRMRAQLDDVAQRVEPDTESADYLAQQVRQGGMVS